MFADNEDLVDIKNAFEEVIKYINSEKELLKENRKKIREHLYNLFQDKEKNKKKILIVQEEFAGVTYMLKNIIEISRKIEDVLFKYDLGIEEEN